MNERYCKYHSGYGYCNHYKKFCEDHKGLQCHPLGIIIIIIFIITIVGGILYGLIK